MSLREWAFERFFADIADRRVAQRVDALREATNRQKQVEGFRRLTDAERDLSPVTHDRQREIAVYLYTYNPVARRLMETIREWILGEGVKIKAPNPRTQAYLDRWWNDRGNRWDRRLWEQSLELFLMGERFWPVFTNQYSGIMRFGTIDPQRVKEVVTDPDNVEMTLGVILKAKPGLPERRYRSVLVADDLDVLSSHGLAEWENLGTDGELFTFAVNRLSTQTRGISELFSLADWLDGYEQLLFNVLRREQALSNYVWDVTLEGMDQPEIDEWLKNQKYPKPLSIQAHNEKVKWELRGPSFGSGNNNAEHARLFRNHILAGEAIPEHWMGGGGDVNRATGESMSVPTEKSFTAKQRTVKHVMEDVLRAQVQRGVEHGEILERDADAMEVAIEFPELSSRDLSKVAASFQGLAAGLALFGREGWVDDETSVRVLASLAQQIGLEVDPEEVLERARAQKQDRLADEAARAFDRRTPVVEA